MTLLRSLGFATVVLIGALPSSFAAELSTRLSARNSLTAAALQAHVAVLADDTFEGREAGKRGGRAAAGYLVEKLKSFGLQGAGDSGGFLQEFHPERRNVLAQLPGSDPELRKEVIIICAHYDHVGYGNSRNSFGPFGYIHNGADDNASGVAGVLEAARVLSELKAPLKRTIMFAFWDAEESGLFGSKHWLARPTATLADVRFVVNLDMIGRLRNDQVEVYGSRTAAGARALLTGANVEERLTFDYKWEMREDSDHAPFFHKRIPVVMLHTGKHDDYHRPSDDVEKLNYDGILKVSRVVLETLIAVADADELPRFRLESVNEAVSERRREAFELPYPTPPGRLGVSWHHVDDDGIHISHVQVGTPAFAAGLRHGERIAEWDGHELNSEEQFQRLVMQQAEPVNLTVVGRDGTSREVAVELQGSPVRIGVSWAEDDAEPGSVLVKRVVDNSPAQRAGLLTRDRIVQINGKSFRSVPEFETRLDEAQGKLTFTVDRDGVLETLELQLDTGA